MSRTKKRLREEFADVLDLDRPFQPPPGLPVPRGGEFGVITNGRWSDGPGRPVPGRGQALSEFYDRAGWPTRTLWRWPTTSATCAGGARLRSRTSGRRPPATASPIGSAGRCWPDRPFRGDRAYEEMEAAALVALGTGLFRLPPDRARPGILTGAASHRSFSGT